MSRLEEAAAAYRRAKAAVTATGAKLDHAAEARRAAEQAESEAEDAHDTARRLEFSAAEALHHAALESP